MARIVTMVDDFAMAGGDRTAVATQTNEVWYNGMLYTIDLCDSNASAMDRDFRKWLDVAHHKTRLKLVIPEDVPAKVTAQAKTQDAAPRGANMWTILSDEDRNECMAWASDNGIKLVNNGTRVPAGPLRKWLKEFRDITERERKEITKGAVA